MPKLVPLTEVDHVVELRPTACQLCGQPVTEETAQLDHIKPVRWFKLPVAANHPDNLWTLCLKCHPQKTKFDRQRESRMP